MSFQSLFMYFILSFEGISYKGEEGENIKTIYFCREVEKEWVGGAQKIMGVGIQFFPRG